MRRIEIKNLVSILIDSPFYLTIPLTERYLLMKGLVKDYPGLFKNKTQKYRSKEK
jgi:hypothetical protein